MLFLTKKSSLRSLSARAVLVTSVFGFGAACSAADPGNASSVDKNNDGVHDGLAGTRLPDVDLDMDGTIDGPGWDTDGDGEADGFLVDTNGDGVYDAVQDASGNVTKATEVDDGDGKIDVPVPGGDGDGDGSPVQRPSGDFCDEFEVVFEPKTPTVYIAVDRSSSMFDDGYWDTLKNGLLPTISELQGDVRFGFSSYTGASGNEASCGLDASAVGIGQGNYATIEAAWNALGDQRQGPLMQKGETPTSYAIQQATEVLLADESPGGRFILLVSDGSPDMCNDNYNACGVDGTIASLQVAATKGVRTLVFGIETGTVTQSEFDKFAQAGAGEAPVAPVLEGQDAGSYNEHSGVMANVCTDKGIWPTLRTENQANRDAAGMAASSFQPAGAYSSAGGGPRHSSLQTLGLWLRRSSLPWPV